MSLFLPTDYDPNARSESDSGLFGLPINPDAAKVHVLAVPWDATTSYGEGTHLGPESILQASRQVDLFDLDQPTAYQKGFHLEWVEQDSLLKLNQEARQLAVSIREKNYSSSNDPEKFKNVNELCDQMNNAVYKRALQILKQNKLPALIGGDHSTPYGLIKALTEKYNGDFGVLHLDAHLDLRMQFEGFQFSHASIFRNVMELPYAPKKLVQVGIRDFCKEELDFTELNSKIISVFFDRNVKSEMFKGQTWDQTCDKIIQQLPKNVYVSFDIDGLSPEFCPSTGTPVPGGLSYDQAIYLLSKLTTSGRRWVGFDLNETSPSKDSGDEWDANVAARLLFHMCNQIVASNL